MCIRDSGYTVKMPEKWLDGTVTAIVSEENGTTAFYEWNNKALGAKLFEIKVFDAAEWDKGRDNDDYILIYKDNRYAYTFTVSDSDSGLSLTDDEIKRSFAILKETAV